LWRLFFSRQTSATSLQDFSVLYGAPSWLSTFLRWLPDPIIPQRLSVTSVPIQSYSTSDTRCHALMTREGILIGNCTYCTFYIINASTEYNVLNPYQTSIAHAVSESVIVFMGRRSSTVPTVQILLLSWLRCCRLAMISTHSSLLHLSTINL
jgi:hypothetical protein